MLFIGGSKPTGMFNKEGRNNRSRSRLTQKMSRVLHENYAFALMGRKSFNCNIHSMTDYHGNMCHIHI